MKRNVIFGLMLLLTVPVVADDCADAWITAKLKTRLSGKSGFGVFRINIDTEQCVVTLNGCVDTDQRRKEAGKEAKKIKKVTNVVNKLTICTERAPEDPDGNKVDDCADAAITAQAKSLIFANEGFAAFKINIDTEQCVITLNGCVDTDKQVSKAVTSAGKAKGARKVLSRLTLCGSDAP